MARVTARVPMWFYYSYILFISSFGVNQRRVSIFVIFVSIVCTKCMIDIL